MDKQNTDFQLPYRISVCGRSEVPAFQERGMTHLLSIDSPGSPTDTPEWYNGVHRHLAFVDVESKTMAVAFGLVAPQRLDVEEILEFGNECLAASHKGGVHLVIHCLAGVSRSPAAAYAIMCMLNGAGCERTAFEYLMHIRHCAAPNRLIVKYADELLGRQGAMIASCS